MCGSRSILWFCGRALWGFLKSISYKICLCEWRLFPNPLTVSCAPLPTEPQLLNNKPCVLNSELGSVEKELSTEPRTTSFQYTIPTPFCCISREIKKHVQTPQIRARRTSPVYHNHQLWKPRPIHHVPHASAAKDQQDLLVYRWHKLPKI